MNILLYPHAGCYNHGCEAIIRSTVSFLNLPKENLLLYSTDPQNDCRYGLDEIIQLVLNDSEENIPTFFNRLNFNVKEKICGGDRDLEEICFRHKRLLKYSEHMVAFSVGGDNYCYVGMQHMLSEFSKLFNYKSIPTVLWACSLEENLISEKVKYELGQYDLITVRESISANILKKIGLGNKSILCADPAFVLPAKEYHKYDEFFSCNDVIGINLSSLITSYEKSNGLIFDNFKKLVKFIIRETDFKIAFIPHVRARGNDDMDSINYLINDMGLKDNSRILSIDDDIGCMELKYIISQCRFLICCRTHASIAGYSSCVPTFVVGYSTKSMGICKDLFGNTEDLLLDARLLKNDTELTDSFVKFMNREFEIKNTLTQVIPEYSRNCYAALNQVNNLIQVL